MIEILNSEIEKYRKDINKNDSKIFRNAVDHRNKEGKHLNNDQINELIICLLKFRVGVPGPNFPVRVIAVPGPTGFAHDAGFGIAVPQFVNG